MSIAITEGVRVEVQSQFLPDRSSPTESDYHFAYTVRISNTGSGTVQLLARHWVITDARGRIEEVKGAGVVGHQPVLKPGESFEYTSGCPLRAPYGTMHGTYQMVREDGSAFDAEIAPFELEVPGTQSRVLN